MALQTNCANRSSTRVSNGRPSVMILIRSPWPDGRKRASGLFLGGALTQDVAEGVQVPLISCASAQAVGARVRLGRLLGDGYSGQ